MLKTLALCIALPTTLYLVGASRPGSADLPPVLPAQHLAEDAVGTRDAAGADAATQAPVAPAAAGGGGNSAPVCDVGPMMETTDCNGAFSTFQLDGSASFDPDDDPLTFLWEVGSDGCTLDDPTSPTPILTADMDSSGTVCFKECGGITLTVTDPAGESSTCDKLVVFRDMTAPQVSCPPDMMEVLWAGGHPTQTDLSMTGMATATDNCDPVIDLAFTDVVQPGMPPTGIEQIVTRTFTATDCMDLTDSCVQTIRIVGPSFGGGKLDLMPSSCPNVFQAGETGLLPVAILGDELLDVSAIDPRTLRLGRFDDVGVALRPTRVRLDDVGTPIAGTNCNLPEPDGISDLVLRFDRAEVAYRLRLEDVTDRDTVLLEITGAKFDGEPFAVRDEVLLVRPDQDTAGTSDQ